MPSKPCRWHPRQEVIGVCALCLKERLLALMMEEEELENARDSFAYSSSSLDQASSCSYNMQDSPPRTENYLTKDVSPNHQALNIFTDNICKAGTRRPSSASRRHGMEYDREDVRKVAALYLQRQHSLSSSPLQKQKFKFPSPLLTSQQDQPCELNDSFRDFARINQSTIASTPRKKRGSLWSLLQRHGGEAGNSSDVVKDLDKVELHRRSSVDSTFPGTCSHTDQLQGDQFSNEHHKLLHPSFMKGAHDLLSGKDNAYSSLLAYPMSFRPKQAARRSTSPHFFSPARSGHCMVTPSPSPSRQPGGAEGQKTYRNAGDASTISKLRRELFAEDKMSRVRVDGSMSSKACQRSDHLHSNKSWVSSILFPRKDKLRSKEITMNPATYTASGASHLHATDMPSRRHSVSTASPELLKAPRRKSVSFLDDHVAARTSTGSNNIRSEASSPHRKPQNQMNMTRLGELHGVKSSIKSSNSALQDHGNAKKNLYPLSIVSEDEQLVKSPRMRLASLLPKRRSMGYMDCTRDMRVSPAPISLQEISRQSQYLDSPKSAPHAAGHAERLSTQLHHHHRHQYDTVLRFPSSSPLKLQMRASSKDTGRDAALEDVDAMINAQYLADCKSLMSTATPKASKGWSATFAWSKTLSPMLGLRGKKKKKKKKKSKEQISSCHRLHKDQIRSRDCADREMKLQIASSCIDHNMEHDSIQYSPFDKIPAIRGSHIAPVGQEFHDCRSSPSLRLRREFARKGGIKNPNLSPKMVFTPDQNRPPHQYSFLSKDYSAFSFYFSPARSSSCSSNGGASNHGRSSSQNYMMMMSSMIGDHQQRRASISSSTVDAYSAHHHHQQQLRSSFNGGLYSPPPRHSVDGASWTSYPSLSKQSSNGR